MKLSRILKLVAFSVTAVTLTSPLATQAGGTSVKTRPPRFSAPKDGRPGYVNTVEYFQIDDPKRAAHALLEEAALAQVDIERTGESTPRKEIEVAAGTFEPRREDQLISEGAPTSGDTICLLKLQRGPSIAEIADIMNLGVRLFKGIPNYTYIARIPFGALDALRSNTLVEWIGAYEPAQKIPTVEFPHGQQVAVFSLTGDQSTCRRDLEGIGADVVAYSENVGNGWATYTYTIKIDENRVSEIAELWWVERLAPNYEIQGRGARAEIAATFSGHYRPYDSRRLISDTNSFLYEGDDITALVFDDGCYHQHLGLYYRVFSSLSDGFTDTFHGTHVAGILLGEHASSVSGGGIAGVATRAHFIFKSFHTHTLSAAYSAPGIQIANNSWAVVNAGQYVFSYEQKASELDAFAADSHDILSILVAGEVANDIEAPGTAKNALTVGSIRYVTTDPTWDVLGMLGPNSGAGPTRDDQRLKPDLVAPGGTYANGIVSCKSPTSQNNPTWDAAAGGYAAEFGTSQAAPHVAGAAAIVANWYNRYIADNNLSALPNYAPTSQLYRALLVNAAIPLRWDGQANSTFSPSLQNALPTNECKSGFANGEYGYGLVNANSGVLSTEDEYRRILIWQDNVERGLSIEKTVAVRSSPMGNSLRPRYLVATMAYDDVPATAGDQTPLMDRLDFTLIAPDNTPHHFVPPAGFIAGTVEKVIIPWPAIGDWKARVTFSSTTDTSPSRPFPQQAFAVVIDLMDEAPKLSVTVKGEHTAKTGTFLEIPVVISNVGGNVAAGVTVRLNDLQHRLLFGSGVDTTFYVGNIPRSGESVTKVFKLRLPTYAQDVPLSATVDLINKIADGTYPIQLPVMVHAVDKLNIKGNIVVFPGGAEDVEGAEILVNGVPSGKKTNADGSYDVEINKGTNVTIRPRKGTTTFLPSDTTYSNVMSDKDHQNYKARFRKISGMIRDENGARLDSIVVVPTVAKNALFRGQSARSDDAGLFEAYVEHGWTGKFVPRSTPLYATYTVESPAHASFDSIVTDVTNLNFRTRRAALWGAGGTRVSTSARSQYPRFALAMARGGALVVWVDANTKVRAQRISSGGSKLWDQNHELICTAAGDKLDARVVRLDDDTFVLAWMDKRSGNWDIYAQRLSAIGEPLWLQNGIAVCQAVGDQQALQLAGANSFVIAVWEDRRSGSSDVYAQRINSDATTPWGTPGIAVAAVAGDQRAPSVAVHSGAGAYIAWEDKRPGVVGISDTYMQLISGQGAPVWSAHGKLVSMDNKYEVGQKVAVSTDGSCFISYGIFGSKQSYLANIGPDGATLWGWKSIPADLTSIAADGDGGIFVAGVSLGGPGGCSATYYRPLGLVRHYDDFGFDDWGIDNVTDGRRVDGAVVTTAVDGGAIVVWKMLEDPCGTSVGDLVAQRYDVSGFPTWGSGFSVAVYPGTDQRYPFVTHDLVSGAFVCWNDGRSGPQSIYASHINNNSLIYTVSGLVRDSGGAGVAGVEVSAVDGDEVLVTKKTASNGSYTLGVPAFWNGQVRVRLRGTFNAAAPEVVAVGPALAPLQGVNFTLRHESTQWQKAGLLLRENAGTTLSVSLANGGARSLVAWNGGGYGADGDAYVQLIDPTGDLQWTRGGDNLISTNNFSDQDPQVVARSDSKFLVAWKLVSSPNTYGLRVQLLDEDMTGLWGANGIVVCDDDVSMFATCADGSNGAFFFWHSNFSQKVFLQHVSESGLLTWQQPIYLNLTSEVFSAKLCPDGVGGVIAAWHASGQGETHLFAQRVNSAGNTQWGGPSSWNPVNVRPAPAYQGPVIGPSPADFRMLVHPFGGAVIAWSEAPHNLPSEPRIRFNWVQGSGSLGLGTAGLPLNSLPGDQYICDMAGRFDNEDTFLVLYDETDGPLTGRLVLQSVPLYGGPDSRWPANGVTVAPPAARFVGMSRIIPNYATGGGIVFWEEEPNNIFAQSVDSLGNSNWITTRYGVTETGTGMSVGSDGQNGAIAAWHGLDGGLYATRINESVATTGDVNVSTFVRRKPNGVVEPISTARAVVCPKGELDDLIFRVELSGQMTTPFSADALTLQFPPASSEFSFLSFRTAVADSAMRLDGDRYRTTITLREFGGGGSDSVAVLSNGYLIAHAAYNAISPDASTSGPSGGDVGLADLSKLAVHYPTSANPAPPYSPLVDYLSPQPVLATRPNNLITLQDFGYLQSHWGHKKPAVLLTAGAVVANSGGRVVLSFAEAQSAGQRVLKVNVSLADVERYTVAYFALRNENPLFEFEEWTPSPSFPYTTISAPAVRDGDNLVGIGVVTGKNPAVWNGELGTIEMRVSSNAPLELTDDDFSLVTGELLAVTGEVLTVSMRDRAVPRKYDNNLSQNYPNPFNPTTTISYSLASAGHVDLTVFDVRGAVVKRLVNGERKANSYHVVWDGTNNNGTSVASGVYFYRLRAPKFTASKKMLLLK